MNEILHPATVMKTAILPAMTLLPEKMHSNEAIRMLLTIGMQESRFKHRQQINGPAKSYWQFERPGVNGVLTHNASKDHAKRICRALNYELDDLTIWRALEHNDVLAAVFARLLLWTDPKPLPVTAEKAWQLYLRTWRPGKPHWETWTGFYESFNDEISI